MIKKLLFFLLLIKLSLSTECQDGTSCPGNQKCCASKDGINCCPYSKGVCCSDMKHCCPSGYTCSTNGACLLNNNQIINDDDVIELPFVPTN